MPGKKITEAYGDLYITGEPTSTPSSNRVYFQRESDGLEIMWRYSGGSWEGRCIAPHVLSAAPTFTSIVANELAIVTNDPSVHYLSANAGTTTWIQVDGGSGGGGC